MGAKIIQPPAFQRPSGKMWLMADMLNLVDGVATLVELDTIPAEYTDGIENVATHRITPGVAGFYSIVGQVTFSNVVADKNYVCYIYISGTFLIPVHIQSSFVSSITAINSLPNRYLTAVDYVELWAQSESGDNTVDITLNEMTFLAVQRVR